MDSLDDIKTDLRHIILMLRELSARAERLGAKVSVVADYSGVKGRLDTTVD